MPAAKTRLIEVRRIYNFLKRFYRWILLSLFETLPDGSYTNPIKARIMRHFGCTVGNNPTIHAGVWIRPLNKLILGDNVVLSRHVIITTAGTVTVGNNVLVGYGSKILSANHIIPSGKQEIRFSGHEFKPVVIADNVWIASQVVVLPGVKIGEGAVIAAGAVVTKNIPPYAIAAGVPAQIINWRIAPKDQEYSASGISLPGYNGE